MTPADRDALAGEYVLSLMSEDQAVAFERRMSADRDLAVSVAGWRERFHELDLVAAPVAPPATLWSRIALELDAAQEPAPAPRRAARGGISLAGLWSNLTVWRGAALAGAAASAALAVALGALALRPSPAPTVIAVLLAPDQTPGAVVEVFGDGSASVATLADITVPNDRALQVWTLPDPAGGPVSIGLMPTPERVRLAPAALPAPKARQLYEITLEPAAGSPTGRPTGPILFKGYAEPPR
jgi:anti-sigma-K factor RskA